MVDVCSARTRIRSRVADANPSVRRSNEKKVVNGVLRAVRMYV
jgi:hypothetical protein